CEHAVALAPNDPTPWVVLQNIAQGLRYGNDEYRGIWHEIVSREPLHVAAHSSAMLYWLPRWFGSDELVEAFVEDATRGRPPGSLLTQIRLQWLYMERIPRTADERTAFYHGPMVASAIDAAIEDLHAASPEHPSYATQRHWLAYFLTQSGRYTEAYQMFQAIGPYYGSWPWLLANDPATRFTGVRADAVLGWEDAGRPSLPGESAAESAAGSAVADTRSI
ncbi:MAG TPA: hypothetical protein VH442_13590, partial [Micromonosporaceae bacterium]